MGTISRYGSLINPKMARQPIKIEGKVATKEVAGNPILPDAECITLAEYDVDTKNAITAHHIKDYRRRKFNLIMLPRVETLFKACLRGRPYWNEKLKHENEDADL